MIPGGEFSGDLDVFLGDLDLVPPAGDAFLVRLDPGDPSDVVAKASSAAVPSAAPSVASLMAPLAATGASIAAPLAPIPASAAAVATRSIFGVDDRIMSAPSKIHVVP